MGPRPAGQEKAHPESQPHAVSRRELLAGAAATLAVAFVPVSCLFAAQAAADILTPTERQTLEAVVARIIPADDTSPGALEAGCARYIESALGDAYQSLKQAYSAGLAALNAQAMASVNKPFAAAGASEQDKLLSDFEKNVKVGDYSGSASFFEMMRRHTLEGMFGDPAYGGNANFAGWDLIAYPGPRMYVPPELQALDAKPPRTRLSAEQVMHGSH